MSAGHVPVFGMPRPGDPGPLVVTCVAEARSDPLAATGQLLARPASGPGIKAPYDVRTSVDFIVECWRLRAIADQFRGELRRAPRPAAGLRCHQRQGQRRSGRDSGGDRPPGLLPEAPARPAQPAHRPDAAQHHAQARRPHDSRSRHRGEAFRNADQALSADERRLHDPQYRPRHVMEPGQAAAASALRRLEHRHFVSRRARMSGRRAAADLQGA